MIEELRYPLGRAARGISEANHVSFHGLVDVHAVHSAVFQLDTVAGRLPQLLRYLGRCLQRAEAGGFRDDRGTDPTTLLEAQSELVQAAIDLEPVADHIERALSQLTHLARNQEDQSWPPTMSSGPLVSDRRARHGRAAPSVSGAPRTSRPSSACRSERSTSGATPSTALAAGA